MDDEETGDAPDDAVLEEFAEFVDESPPPSKRTKPNPKPFRRDLDKDHASELARVKKALLGKTRFCSMGGAYQIPLSALRGGELTVLRAMLRTKPKPAYHMGRRVDKPWDLYLLTKDAILLPRPLGIKLGGLPPTVRVVDAPVVFPEPRLPLLDEQSARAMFKTPQEGHVTKLVYDLNSAVAKQGFGSCMYSIPTSHGKTASAVHIASRLGQRMLFITNNDSVHSLNEEEFRKFLGDDFVVGRMQTSNRKAWKNVDAPIVQTTHKSAAECSLDVLKFGTVIVDEAHKTSTPTLKQIYMKFPCRYLIMLTATPSRAGDHCGAYLEWLGGPVSCYVRINFAKNRWGGVTIREVPYTYKKHAITEKRDKGRDGRHYTDLPATHNITMYRRDRNAALVRHIKSLVDNEERHIIAVCVRILHVERMVKALQEIGVSAGALVGEFTSGRKQTPEERAKTFKCRVIVAYISIAVEALNIPRIDTVMMLSGGCAWNNETFWLQFLGRAVRDKVGKNKPLVVLPRDETTHGVFERQVEKAKKEFAGLGDGLEFIVGRPVAVN